MLALSAVLLAASRAGGADGPDVDGAFLEAWRLAGQQPDGAVEVWSGFLEAHRQHDLGQVARLALAVELLRRGGDRGSVLGHLRADPAQSEPSALRKSVAEAAGGLVALLEMDRLREALQRYYRRHVEYPRTLEDLVGAQLASAADLQDPFGRSYVYAARARRLMPDLARQTYTLRAASLDAQSSDLATLLERTAAPLRQLTLLRVMPERDLCEVEAPGRAGSLEPRRWKVGTRVRGVTLWAVRPGAIVVGRQQIPEVLEPVDRGPSPPADAQPAPTAPDEAAPDQAAQDQTAPTEPEPAGPEAAQPVPGQ